MAGKAVAPKNSLLATGGSFSLSDSFGTIAPLPISRPSPLPSPALTASSSFSSLPSNIHPADMDQSAFIGQGDSFLGATSSFQTPGFSNPASFFTSPAGLHQLSPSSVDLAPPHSTLQSPPISLSTPVPPPHSLVTPAPPPLKPSTPLFPSNIPLFTPGSTPAPLTSGTLLKRPVYAPDPFMSTSAIKVAPLGVLGGGLGAPGGLPPKYTTPGILPSSQSSVNLQTIPPGSTGSGGPGLNPSYSSPNLQSSNPYGAESIPGQNFKSGADSKSNEVMAHWFYKPKSDSEVWKPFGVDDSFLVEAAYSEGSTECIPVEGTRYDVLIPQRLKRSVYWAGEDIEIRRCTWFNLHSQEGRWVPYEEDVAERLEAEFMDAQRTGMWQRKILLESGDWVMIHSPEVIMHFPTSSANHGALDDWGQVQPSSDPALKPRVVHRGLDGLPDIPDSECEEVDHLCFLVHGIGSACDMRFRSIFEVVDTYRDLTGNISAKHFAGAHLASSANRVEFLPVDWHSKLHREDEGTDNRLKPLTLRSVPKLRSFVNDTLLDVLFYTSPVYCQTILDTVCSEINKVYKLFKDRNPDFSGGVSLIGHSLGSLILFDLLSGQPRTEEEEVKDILEGEEEPGAQDLNDSFKVPVKPRWDSELSLEEVFSKLEISEYTQTFINQGISMDELAACSEEDLKEAELPLGPRKKLINFMRRRNESGFQEFQNSAVRSRVDYTVGPAGTGQPFVRYPRLDIKPEAFFAFGSPIGMFMAVRGIQSLGPDFKFPTCDRFFNIFHPYDPVAYRIESLVGHEYSDLRPVLIPHHKGRKRMHLELKETMTRMGTDIKQKFMDSLKAVYSMAGTLTGSQAEQTVEEMVDDRESISPTQECEGSLTAELNKGRRIDYVLQEAPMESFNEYLWSLASHLCYWSSEDTALMVLKEIYNLRNVYPDDRFGEGTQSRTVQPGTETYSSNSTYSAPPTFTAAPPSISVPPTFPSYSSPPSFQPMTPFPPISSTGFSGTPTIGYSATPTTGYSATPTTGYNATPTTGYSATPTIGYSATPTSGYSATPTIGYSATPTIGYSPTPTPVSIPSGPPPTFFSPASIPVAPVSSTTRSLIYPRPVGTGTGTGGPGMDPTAPVETDKPIPPPPKMAGGMMQ